MGKSKQRKHNMKNNIFKVAGCKSLKAKNKAKSVTADRLKQLSVKNKQKINEIDDQLMNLNEEVRQPPKEVEKNSINNSFNHNSNTAERQEKIRKYQKSEENSQLALDKFCSMAV